MAELKNTKQRGAILRFLENSPDPVSAEDIFVLLKPSFPQLALSTVYRNLERFTSSGVLQKIKLDDCPLSPLELQLAKATGFEIERHSLTIYGKCPDCQKKRGTRADVKKVERTQ